MGWTLVNPGRHRQRKEDRVGPREKRAGYYGPLPTAPSSYLLLALNFQRL